MSKKNRVLSIAFVTGEDIEPKGLPVLKIYKGKNQYILLEGEEAITSALIESLEHLEQPDHTLLFLVVDIVSKRPRRQEKGGEA